MPKLDCPLGDFTSTSEQTATAAKELADHLLKAHCRTPFPLDANVIDPDLMDVALREKEAKARIQTGPAKADLEAER